MNEKNCINCFNLRTKLPLRGNEDHPLLRKFNYPARKAWCSQGQLVTYDGKMKFFRIHYSRKRKSFEQAKVCPYYDGEEEKEEI